MRVPHLVVRIASTFPIWLAACADEPHATGPTSASIPSRIAPVLLSVGARIPDTSARYIVVLRDRPGGADNAAEALAAQYATTTRHVYRRALNGFAATLAPNAVDALRRNPQVAYIELDRKAYLDEVDTEPGWGLDRIDQRFGPIDHTFTSSYDGTGVTIYVLDTGVRASHPDFEGRVEAGWTQDHNYQPTEPCHHHGTAVASVAGGQEYGVAKNARIVALRGSYGCDKWGYVSDWVAGMDWIISNHTSGPAVMNFSVSTSDLVDNLAPGSMNTAVKNVKNDGIFVVVSAGNNNDNACNYSPANALEVMTVGASNISDNRSAPSNWGGCVDIFAPGEFVMVAQLAGDGFEEKSGTTYAAAYVSGVGALLLQRFPSDSPDQIHYMIVGGASHVIGNTNGSTDGLVYSNVPSVPTVSISGPTLVGFNNFGCQWSAVVAGGRQPYTYQWSGIRSGSQSSVNGPVSEGTLNLDVWDSIGLHGQASLYVTVDPNNPGDPLCTGI